MEYDETTGLLPMVPQLKIKSKEDLEIQKYLLKMVTKIPKQQKEAKKILDHLDPRLPKNIVEHIRGPISKQIADLFSRQFELIRRADKSKISWGYAVNEFDRNRKRIDRMLEMVRDIMHY